MDILLRIVGVVLIVWLVVLLLIIVLWALKRIERYKDEHDQRRS